MRYLLFLVCLLLSINAQAYDWGQTGHRATGAIAENYLTYKTKRAIADLLDGQSLAFVSTYGDEIKSDNAFRMYGPWHYVNVPFDSTYEEHEHNDKGDIITGIDTCIKIIKSKTATKQEKAFHLKLLVHFIGDLHQPMHVGIGDDKGGNDFQVSWYNNGTNLHSVWDSRMIESYGMTYSELADNMPALSKEERQKMQSGTHRDWMVDSRVVIKDIYANTEVGEKLGYRYMYDYFDTVRNQLQKGGVRLAGLLNELLG
ncbi:S1/P1 nuclease [Nonlabens antarcticus]|uniref:S1/P1 nuclease n=1 Tax=Nonlabens antarcticus TaxID=392714 RepID=UPI0018912B83|nr:S1/P1 nuclease [Nonlabens antarcticus]